MKITLITLMIFISITGLLTGCQPATEKTTPIGDQDAEKTASPVNGDPLRIDEQDTGKTITLKTGQILLVSLEGNITTGFNWIPAPQEPALLEQVSEPEVTPTSDLPGAPGKIVLQFKATGPGQTLLHLDYKRIWEKNTPPEKEFEVKVIVK